MEPLITPQMKVDAVLNRFPQTLPIFVAYGFKPLENPILRKTFAPLITLHGATKMHHWPAERVSQFLGELNAVAAGPCAAPLAESAEAPPLFDLHDVEGLRAVNIVVTPEVVHLDNRGLEQPEPMVRILSVASQLAPGQHLEAINVRKPMLLYPKLDELGYEHLTETLDDGHFRITVRRRS